MPGSALCSLKGPYDLGIHAWLLLAHPDRVVGGVGYPTQDRPRGLARGLRFQLSASPGTLVRADIGWRVSTKMVSGAVPRAARPWRRSKSPTPPRARPGSAAGRRT